MNDTQTAGILFILGIIASLLNATVNQEIYNRIAEPILYMVDYWFEVSITGEENEETHDKIEQKMKNIKKYSWIGPVMGWASGLLFIAGVINVAINLK